MKEVTVNGEVYIKKSEDVNEDVNEEKCIVRTYSAGVFFGTLVDEKTKDGATTGTVLNARRIWYWSGAASLSQLAVDGTSDPDNCKFPCEVAKIYLKNIIEVIPCTYKAIDSINSVAVWSE